MLKKLTCILLICCLIFAGCANQTGESGSGSAASSAASQTSDASSASKTASVPETSSASGTSQTSGTPEPVKTPEPTKTPAPTKTPEPTQTPESTQTPEPTETPEPTLVPDEEKELIADYYERVVGTPMEMPYEEVVLYSTADGLLLEYWENGGTVKEKVSVYSVPEDPSEDISAVVEYYQMNEWNDWEDLYGITGAAYVCKFWYGDEIYRVSSDYMPDEGFTAFGDFAHVLYSCMDEQNLLYEVKTGAEDAAGEVLDYADMYGFTEWIMVDEEDFDYYFYFDTVYDEDSGETSLVLCCRDDFVPDESISAFITYTCLPVISEEELQEAYDYYLEEYGEETADAMIEEMQTGSLYEDEVTYYHPWEYSGGEARTRIFTVSGAAEFTEIYVIMASGYICRFEIPEEYLQEDENGTYFLFGSAGDRYYLSGMTGYETDDGTVEITEGNWIPDMVYIISNELY